MTIREFSREAEEKSHLPANASNVLQMVLVRSFDSVADSQIMTDERAVTPKCLRCSSIGLFVPPQDQTSIRKLFAIR